jgi:hypothetical protein
MATTAPTSSTASSRPTYSCIRCAERKVKCDRQRPCSACIKHNVECVRNPSRPPQRRPKRVKDQVLIDRIRLYETLLQHNGIDPNKLPDTPDSELGRKSNQTVAEIPLQLPSQAPSIQSETSRRADTPQVIRTQERSAAVDKLVPSHSIRIYANT